MKTLERERKFLATIAVDYEWNEVKKVLPVDEYGVKVQVKTPKVTTKWMSFKDLGPIQLEEYLDQDATVKLKSTKGETKWLNVDENIISAVKTLDDQLRSKSSAKEDLYNLVSLRNGKKVVWNKKPLPLREIEKMEKQLQKAKIPSVDLNSIDVVKVGVNKAEIEDKVEVDQKESDKKKRETLVWINDIVGEAEGLLKEVQKMRNIDKDQEDLIKNWLELIEGAAEKIRKVLK